MEGAGGHRQLFPRQRSKDDFPADINKPFPDAEAEPRRFRVRRRDVTYFPGPCCELRVERMWPCFVSAS